MSTTVPGDRREDGGRVMARRGHGRTTADHQREDQHMTTDQLTDAERYARVIADEVRDLEDGILDGHDLTDHDPADRPYEAAMRWVADLALDVEVTRSTTTGDVTAVTITRTLGGPWCAVTFDRYGEHTVRASWGRDRAEVILAGREVATVADVILDTFSEVTA